MPTVPAPDLQAFCTTILAAAGLSGDEAASVAASLVGADLRGLESHGVLRVPYYADAIRQGDVRPGAPLTILRQTPSLLMADAKWGLGQIQARRLTELLVDMAPESGVVCGTLIHSGHIGRLGEYCELAADAGLVSLLMVNTHGHARRVAPPGGKVARLGTNPIAFGTPSAVGPLVLDFGTSVTAEGRVRARRIAGEACPEGWLLDSEGRPTTDPHALYADPPGTILPMGGAQTYRGFGLALMVEILAGAISGGVCAREVPINPNGNCLFMLVVDPAATGGLSHFDAEVTGLIEFIRGCPRIAGVERIMLPGDPERETLARRTATGIPVGAGVWNSLLDTARRLGVASDSVPTTS